MKGPVVEDFPSNSQRRALPRKEEPETERKVIHKVVEGEVIRRKKPMGKRLRESFLGTERRSILEMIAQDVIIPSIKNMVFEAGQQGLARSLFPDSPSASRGMGFRPGDPRRTNYNGISRGPASPVEDRQLSRRARANHDFGELVIPTYPEARGVLEGMFAILEEYNIVAVSDMMELAGVSSQFTDRNYGWTAANGGLLGADIRRVRDGWVLDLPPTEVLK